MPLLVLSPTAYVVIVLVGDNTNKGGNTASLKKN